MPHSRPTAKAYSADLGALEPNVRLFSKDQVPILSFRGLRLSIAFYSASIHRENHLKERRAEYASGAGRNQAAS